VPVETVVNPLPNKTTPVFEPTCVTPEFVTVQTPVVVIVQVPPTDMPVPAATWGAGDGPGAAEVLQPKVCGEEYRLGSFDIGCLP
jgi:hypothetical protein